MGNESAIACRKLLLALAVLCALPSSIISEEPKPTEAAKAYSALSTRIRSRPENIPPAKWNQTMASELEQFASKFAADPEAAKARRYRLQRLQEAAHADASFKPEFLAATDAVWKDAKADPDERANARLLQLRLQYESAVPGGDLLILWNEFPGADSVAVALANGIPDTVDADLRTKMLLALRDTPGVHEKHRTFAEKILSGEVKPLRERVGENLQLRFKAIDGRQVDVQKLRGKVVLVDFWATWCGPCLADMPELKKLHQEYHGKGLEVVGISFDESKSKLESYVKKEKIPWPQYFDGKGWDNEIGNELALRNVPTVVLLDKAGVLRFLNPRKDLADKIQQLLAE